MVGPTAGTGGCNRDPMKAAKEKLFPPIANRTLSAAVSAIESDHVAIAEQLLARHLKKKPRDVEALNLMADVARRATRFEDAEKLLSQCLALAPDSVGYRYNYAVVLRRLNKNEAALAVLERLVELEPANPLFRNQRATGLSDVGRHEEALELRRRLAKDYPDSADIWLRYAHALRDMGFQDECIAAIHRALALSPALAGGYSSLAGLKVYRFTPAETECMETLIADKSLASEDRTALHHALGQAYGDSKLYAKSFENYAKANAQKRLRSDFDGSAFASQRAVFERFFDARLFRDRNGWGCDSRAPIFIVGMPRSGSTLLEQILSSHSAIDGLGERADLDMALLTPLQDFGDEIQLKKVAAGNVVDKGELVRAYIRIFGRMDAKAFRRTGEHYLALAARNRTQGHPFFTDKSLRNFFFIGLIHLILPNAKIVDARRHPLDCGWSCFKSQFRGSDFALRLADIGHDYANYVRLMNHFDRVLPGRIHRVIHERLIADPRGELLRLFEYLDIPFEDSCLRFYENPRAVATQSSEQVRKPLNRSGMAQWVPYVPWLGPLKSALGAVLDSYPDAPKPDNVSSAAVQSNSGTSG